jgi:uncharacterized membrane protein YhdT
MPMIEITFDISVTWLLVGLIAAYYAPQLSAAVYGRSLWLKTACQLTKNINIMLVNGPVVRNRPRIGYSQLKLPGRRTGRTSASDEDASLIVLS